MSAYIFAQCFTKYNEETFSILLKDFRMALQDLGFPEHYIATYVDKVAWEISENGFMYTGCNMPSEKIMINDRCFSIRPLIMGFTPEGYDGLKENWVEFSFLFDEDEVIKDCRIGEIYDYAKQTIWIACNVLSKHFYNEIVYLTDESTDVLPWEALLGLYKYTYCFDLAIVPNNYLKFYGNIPNGYKNIELANKTYILRLLNWDNEHYII